MRKQKGFSLIELLIVVAIILIIAAIAIPNLLRSRMAANEASAVGSVRTINTAEVTYASTYPDLGFTCAQAADLYTKANLIDSVLSTADANGKSGYLVTVANCSGAVPETTYEVTANPVTPGTTGIRYFFSDQSGVIRFSTTAPAVVTDAPLQ